MASAPRSHYQVTFGILAVGIGAFAPQRRPGTAATEAAAVGTLAMSGDAVTAESATGETVASELGE